MAQLKPILSLYIPIYNRLSFLERQLARMLEDRDLFEEQIQLIVSDNCSEDDLKSCCEKYQQLGLHLTYHRNETNIGADGNFEWCFYHAEGKYVWLLGSDDILKEGVLRKILSILDSDVYGHIHLSMKKRSNELTVFQSADEMAIEVNYWITFMSANIIRTDTLKSVDLTDYKTSLMIQVPAFLNACCTSDKNAIVYFPCFFETETDNANNGGYNFFEVFVRNLFSIYATFVRKGLLTKQTFNAIKKVEFKNFLVGYIVDLLILKRNDNFETKNGWTILIKHYWNCLYAYYYLGSRFIKAIKNKFIL